MNPINLLLVDDEKSFIKTVAQRLNKRGFNASTASNVQEAFDRVEVDDTLDVIIMDISMPGMDGIEALQKIKEKHPLIEIIMLTGYAAVQSAIESIKFGAFDYLLKPCELDVLISKVNAAVSRKRDRENKILMIRMEPYITVQERNVRISKVLTS